MPYLLILFCRIVAVVSIIEDSLIQARLAPRIAFCVSSEAAACFISSWSNVLRGRSLGFGNSHGRPSILSKC